MKSKTVFVCSSCGNETAKWYGKCPTCGEWNTLVEETAVVKKGTQASSRTPRGEVLSITEIGTGDETRFDTGMKELNRVLGGGAVKGSLVLVGGEPGIGKSTILLQICAHLCGRHKVLYISGEESQRQVKMRAERLGVNAADLYIYSETEIDDVIRAADKLRPEVLIVDSIQTVYKSDMTSAAGSVAQVKECTMALMEFAKSNDITVFVVGHVNKEGLIAGPKVLEHMVDCVLYFEGDRNMTYRILRAAKNRYGSTNEIGVFEMRNAGLVEIENPSAALLEGRPGNVSGTCVACVMEGSRPVLAEIQALVATSGYGTPRRMSNGLDYNRAMLLLAVLEKRAGYRVATCDAFINVIGGLRLDEPAADLPTILAVASSCKDIAIPSDLAAFGEVGLTGELRAVTGAQQRVKEIKRLGFRKCILPLQNAKDVGDIDGIEIIPVKNIRDAIKACLS
ncbi:MAG: DNA repair protein RadA [Ruminococcaceae bacterium]|nr:DNA repair protein RadA [Oscillospiraceae bacterium]